jgi:hypothetical protein
MGRSDDDPHGLQARREPATNLWFGLEGSPETAGSRSVLLRPRQDRTLISLKFLEGCGDLGETHACPISERRFTNRI